MKITKENIPENIASILDGDIECIGVVDPVILEKNIDLYREVLDKYRFQSQIHYVMKVNTSLALLRQARDNGCRVDASSHGELEKALSVGYTGDDITANGPKNEKFLKLCIKNGVTIAVDSISEIYEIIKIGSKENNKKQKIVVRISGFENQRSTRFGILKKFWHEALEIITNNREHIECIGYSFHVDILGVESRAKILWESIEFLKMARKIGIKMKIIDIGGGFGVKYTDSRSTEDLLYNYSNIHSAYPDPGEYTGSHLIERLLSSESTNISVGKFFEENNIELWLEPGRSLLYNVGYIATKVISLREDSPLSSIVIDTNSFGLGMREDELPVDPFLLAGGMRSKIEYKYWILGNLCRERDMIYSRPIKFEEKAAVGDILIFPEMGAYKMDFFETHSIGHPLKSRYYITRNNLFPDT